MELLSPAGNMEMFYQAIHNGADAIYLSGKNYGARKFADNFTNEELISIFKIARIYDVRVYVTVNTLIYESEVNSFLDYISFLYQNGVSAVIMQDLGMINVVLKKFPNLEVHASTQCHNHDNDTLLFWENLGVKRAVLARELSLDEIKKFTSKIEKEIFVYGALCVCYSGCCLFSSMNGGRSGNRGECVGSCRLPYKLLKNGKEVPLKDKYLLSTKDLNTLDNISELMNSGVDSLKIEGRMKSPAYVGYVTRLYRTLTNAYYRGSQKGLTKEEESNLKKLFNREFTKGYLFNDKDIMNIKSPNHIGIPLGRVEKITKQYLYLWLTEDIEQGDGIRFKNSDMGMIVNKLYNKEKKLVKSICKNNLCLIENKGFIKDGDIVLKTTDKKLLDYLKEKRPKKISVSFQAKFKKNQNFVVKISDGKNEASLEGCLVEKAIKQEVSEADIKRCLEMLGDTPYSCTDIRIEKDKNIFVRLGSIKEIRRELITRLTNLREKCDYEPIVNNEQVFPKVNLQTDDNKIHLNAFVRCEEQLLTCVKHNIDSIYVDDYELYLKYKSLNNLYYRIERVGRKNINFGNEKLLVGDLGSIYRYNKNNELIGDYFLNATNSGSVKTLINHGVKRVTLSVEVPDEEIKMIMKEQIPVEVLVYGRIELMITKYCPLKKCLNYCPNCKNSSDKFCLEDKEKRRYPILKNNCLTHILDSKNICKAKRINDYYKMGINHFRIDFFDEDSKKCEEIIKLFQ